MSNRKKPSSCDTFVFLRKEGFTYFCKNSDRPTNEIQNVVLIPRLNHEPEESLACTYVTIPQVQVTNSVLLCKPHWMWGAEMGSNEYGVVIGNEAIDTIVSMNITGKNSVLIFYLREILSLSKLTLI
jgi:secernin